MRRSVFVGPYFQTALGKDIQKWLYSRASFVWENSQPILSKEVGASEARSVLKGASFFQYRRAKLTCRRERLFVTRNICSSQAITILRLLTSSS